MNEILAWVVPLTLTGLVGAVAWIVKLAINLNSLQMDNRQLVKDIDRVENTIKSYMEWDRMQHKELFDRNNEDAKILERLSTLFEGMDKKIDEILDRERSRNGGNH